MSCGCMNCLDYAFCPTSKIGDLEAEKAELINWITEAEKIIAQGIELMPLHHLSQWEGVRGVLEMSPLHSNPATLHKTQSHETSVNCNLGKDEHVTEHESKVCKHDTYPLGDGTLRCRRCGVFWEAKSSPQPPATKVEWYEHIECDGQGCNNCDKGYLPWRERKSSPACYCHETDPRNCPAHQNAPEDTPKSSPCTCGTDVGYCDLHKHGWANTPSYSSTKSPAEPEASEVERLRAALEFYAQHPTPDLQSTFAKSADDWGIETFTWEPMTDLGERARAALNELRKKDPA